MCLKKKKLTLRLEEITRFIFPLLSAIIPGNTFSIKKKN